MNLVPLEDRGQLNVQVRYQPDQGAISIENLLRKFSDEVRAYHWISILRNFGYFTFWYPDETCPLSQSIYLFFLKFSISTFLSWDCFILVLFSVTCHILPRQYKKSHVEVVKSFSRVLGVGELKKLYLNPQDWECGLVFISYSVFKFHKWIYNFSHFSHLSATH